MKLEEIKELMKAMEENGLQRLEYDEGGVHLSLSRGGDGNFPGAESCSMMQFAAPQAGTAQTGAAGTALNVQAGSAGTMQTGAAQAPAGQFTQESQPAASPSAKSTEETFASEKVVTSPLVGTFYASSAPDKEAFVKVGDHVKKGQVLGIIEAMKLMNEIESDYDGVVDSILVNNEEVVEYGQPLFRIR